MCFWNRSLISSQYSLLIPLDNMRKPKVFSGRAGGGGAWGRNMLIIMKYVWLLSFHLQLLEYRSFRLRWNKSVVSWILSMSFGFIYSSVWKNHFQVPTKWGYFFNRPSKRKFKVLSYLWSEKANKLGLIRENIAESWRLLLGGFVLNITLYIPHQQWYMRSRMDCS